MDSIHLRACAKINLGLDVVRRRPDGYHDVRMIMQMLSLCEPPIIKKTRYIVMHDGNRWEVDVFHGDLQGLVIAELEVPSEDYQFALPPFVGLEVTGDKRYYNSQLGVSF